jgi:hypothetical protein
VIVVICWGAALIAVGLRAGEGNLGGLPSGLLTATLAYSVTSALLIRRRAALAGGVLAVAAIGAAVTVVLDTVVTAASPVWLQLVGPGVWLPGCLTVSASLCAAVALRQNWIIAGGAVASLVATAALYVAALVPGGDGAPTIGWTVWIAAALAATGLLVMQWMRGPCAQRPRTGWCTLAHIAVFTAGVFSYSERPMPSEPSVMLLASAVLPAAIVFQASALLLTAPEPVAVGISLARRAVWALLGATLLLGYIAIAVVAAVVAPLTPTTAGLIAVAALVLAVEPTRRWLQGAVDRLLYGRSAEPAALLDELSHRLAAPSLDDPFTTIAEGLRSALRLGHVELRTADDVVVAFAGERSPRAFRIELGDGATILASAASGSTVDTRTVRVLTEVRGLLAVAVQLAVAMREIAEARSRIESVALQERLLVRSELGGHVRSGVLAARRAAHSAAQESTEHPLAASADLQLAAGAVRAATAEVRDLARTLLPSALDAGDLAGALDALAERFDRPVITVESTQEFVSEPLRDAVRYHLVAEIVLRARRSSLTEIAVRLDEPMTLAFLGPAADIEVAVTTARDRAIEWSSRTELVVLGGKTLLRVHG